MNVQALALTLASAQHGENETHCAPRFGMPLHTLVVFLEEPRSFMRDLSSPELSYRTGG